MGVHGGSISGNQSGNMSPHIVLDVKLTEEAAAWPFVIIPGALV